MATIGTNYKGCTAIIKGSLEGSEIRTVIQEHDTNFMTIDVKGALRGIAIGDHVTILVLLAGSAHEFNGVLRKSNAGTSSLTIYNGKVKESRCAVRYVTNSPALVPNLVYDGELYPLCHRLEVTLVNVSTSGALIRTKPNSFVKDAVAELCITIADSETIVQGVVVRIRDIDDENSEYGFKFI
ncbi:MAG: PilZ domain-containing protein [Angelakisella sp.]